MWDTMANQTLTYRLCHGEDYIFILSMPVILAFITATELIAWPIQDLNQVSAQILELF